MIDTSVSLDVLNGMRSDTMVGTLGIEFTEIGEDFLTGKMPVDARTRQPMGILHGGASAALAETLGSIASTLCLDINKQYPVGMELNANHLRSVSSGYVYGTAKAVHIGRRTHVWDIRITDDDNRLICVSRLTMMIITKPGT